ncbi:D-galactose ABC transporter, substrate-binding protein [Escherichia coli]|uniref:D-galactose ABC transporter, substrate-binding protein n=1 Tax=Escherichia coli TaxID=562 RepID=A0A377B967_ECOLX|nr:D-galactose ABC transporter, substrate-binding protein [Escherichia coli]
MNKKVLTLSAVMASMLFGAAAHAADTRIGVTIYKYDDNFMSVVRKAIEQDAKAAPDVQLLMNDSQNDQSKQNDQIDVLLAKGVKALAINLVDPAAAGTVIEKARGQNCRWFSSTKNRLVRRWIATTKPTTLARFQRVRHYSGRFDC